ncbi:MAG: hypothetical protein IJ469_08425 [Candidatus Methanomethylophilaceae archaeon]|nr:hypothetical protein [Candidatus Methanomethylophilaceae archaeon]
MALANHDRSKPVCDVDGCKCESERSFNIKQVSRSSLSLKSEGLRQVHLCKEHYKAYKKETKGHRQIDQVYDDFE